MDRKSLLQSILEFVSSAENIPSLIKLFDVMQKAGTINRQCISEIEIDKAIDALKDLKHSEISKSTGYANDYQREFDKNLFSTMAEGAKKWVKDYLTMHRLIVADGRG